MQAEGTRMFRVKAVAERFDVSVSTIYRAIESGQLVALKLGVGKGSLRITEHALAAFEESCALRPAAGVDASTCTGGAA